MPALGRHHSQLSSPLLERDASLGALRGALADAEAGRGSTAIDQGRGGDRRDERWYGHSPARWGRRARLLVAACDDLVTPRTLGPLYDAAVGTAGLWPALGEDGPVEGLRGA